MNVVQFLTRHAIRFSALKRSLPGTLSSRYSSNAKQIENINFDHNTLLTLFHQQVTNNGDASALIFDDQNVTYSEFYKSCLQCALHLNQQYNVSPGDVVGCITGNVPQIYCVLIAAQMLNAVFFTMNHNLPSDVIQHYIQTTKCKLIISENESIDEILAPYAYQNRIKLNINNETISWIGSEYGCDIINDNDVRLMECKLYDIMRNYQDYNPHNPAILMCTSGSTAIPKIVSHSNFAFQSFLDHPAAALLGANASLLTGQSYHASGYGILSMSACFGGTVIYPSKIMRQPKATNTEKVLEMIRLAEQYAISRVSVIVTPIYEMVKLNLPFPKCVKLIFSGGDIIPTELMAKFIKLHSSNNNDTYILNGYGATECGVLGMSQPLLCNEQNANDIEKIENNLMCLTKDKSVQHKVDEKTNELLVKSNFMFLGYYGDPEKTKECLSEDGYYKTGDTIRVIEDDPSNDIFRFMVIARRKHVIVSQTGYIYPFYIENALLSHSKINGAAIVGVSENILFDTKFNDTQYECAVGFVTVNVKLNEYETRELIEELLGLCEQIQDKNHVPHKIFILDDIPKLSVGKVAKNELIQMAMEYFQAAKAK